MYSIYMDSVEWCLRDAGYHTVALGAVAVYALGYLCGQMLRADMMRDAARIETSGGGASGSIYVWRIHGLCLVALA